MSLYLEHFDTSEQAAQALAGAVAADLHNALQRHETPLLLVSGGRSPLPFFSALSQQPLAWQQIAVSLVDERSVPLTHVDSNTTLVRRHLLINAASSAQWIELVSPTRAEIGCDPWSVAMQAADAANHTPALASPTAIILGIGIDGHTASLFADAPQWPQARSTELRYLAVQPAIAPHARISLSLAALIAQQECYLWAVGADKLATIERCRQMPPTTCALAALIDERRVRLHVFYSPH